MTQPIIIIIITIIRIFIQEFTLQHLVLLSTCLLSWLDTCYSFLGKLDRTHSKKCSFSRPFCDENISSACLTVTNWLSSNLSKLKQPQDHAVKPSTVPMSLSADHYDVFISYSHRNGDVAHLIKEHITSSHPDWRIFIDVADLKTGVAWQTKLYKSIGKRH